jgi:hypothetical protein
MSGETETNVSGWTTDTLREHVRSQIDSTRGELAAHISASRAEFTVYVALLDERALSQTTAMHAALTASKEAISKAEAAVEKRLDGMNEFRGQLADQAATLMPRSESEGEHRRHNERIQDLMLVVARLVTREESQVGMGSLADKIDALATRLDKAEGRGAGQSASWGYLLGAVSLVGTIITIVVILAANGVF